MVLLTAADERYGTNKQQQFNCSNNNSLRLVIHCELENSEIYNSRTKLYTA